MKKITKILALVVVLVMAFSLVACGSSADSKDSAATAAAPAASAVEPAKAELVVAGVVFQDDMFMQLLQAGYVAAAKEAGIKCLTGNTANDQAKESELINTYLTQKVSGIAISPLDDKTSMAQLKKASEAGMKVAVCNTDLSNAPFVVGGYTSDNKDIGKITGDAAAKFITEKLGGKASIAILQFKSQVPAQSKARTDGFLEGIAGLADAKVLADQDAWLADKAVGVAGDIMTANPGINVIWAANEGGTVGASMAVKNAGKAGKVFVFGTDASDQLIGMLKADDNILQAITGQDPYNIGYKTMLALVKAVKGEDVSATQGKTSIAPGILLSRADAAGIDKFQADLKATMGK